MARTPDQPIIREYRIEMPFTTEEFNIGHLYTIMDYSKENTGGGNGIEIVVNEPFEGQSFKDLTQFEYPKGQYTHKLLHIADKVPGFIRMLAPNGTLEIHEKSWNSHPVTFTKYRNDYMKDAFVLSIETQRKEGRATNSSSPFQHNQQIEVIDIVSDPVLPADYTEDSDPKKYSSGAGPLVEGWQESASEIMTCFIRVELCFGWMGLQEKVESIILKSIRRILFNLYRKIYCAQHIWMGYSIEQIRGYEEKIKQELDDLRRKGEVRGLVEK